MKPLYVVGLVVASVAGVVALSGVTKQTGETPRVAAKAETLASAVEAPPFPPLEGEIWNLPSIDARLLIPKGWSIGRMGSDERLLRNVNDPLDGNMNLVLLPNAFGFTVDELLAENVDELSVNPDLHLEDRREIYVMGRKVLRFDYNGTPRTGGEPVRFVAVVWPRGRFQIALTTTVSAKLWS
ncbi:MAG TPA: hypothetical protein VK843_07675, partial [Planctomycetota bacterium]|nr:hypothetical protein [Planctomycetota bacterium]